MKKSRLLGAVCAFTLVILANTAHAAVVTFMSDLYVGGSVNATFDVTFHDGAGDSFNALWDADDDGVFGGSVGLTAPTFWGDSAGAADARDAIIAALGSDDVTTGSSDSFFIPFGANGGGSLGPGQDYINVALDNDVSAAGEDPLSALGAIPDASIFYTSGSPYASFVASSVPVPAAVWLFGSGLLGLIGVARRKVRV